MKSITELEVSFSGEPVGILSWRNRHYWFQYNASWLEQGFDLVPRFLNFDSQPQLAPQPTFKGLHGVFYDSLPDGWGMLLMDRFFKKQFNLDAHEITPLDRLSYMGKRAMGALEYEPVITDDSISEQINFGALIENAEKILAGKSATVLNQLRILGGSPAGARPKVTVALADTSDECVAGISKLPTGFSHYLVKFRGQIDPKDIGRIEKAYAELAIMAGLEMPPNRLITVIHHREKDVLFAVKRFDRSGEQKFHMLTLAGLLYADYRMPSLDYQALLGATAMLTKDMREIKRAFRLMAFNVAAHNKDDHGKNFAFLCNRQGEWRLSPAFDLTFSQGINNEHTTAINGTGNPSRRDFAALAATYKIDDWETIVDEVIQAVAEWPTVAAHNKVTKGSAAMISNALQGIECRLRKI
ncbi:MAG: type II toxin-antitoxin system HipA family toxin [Gammaproteobacteria bacterium]